MPTDLKDPLAMQREQWPETWDAVVMPFVFALHRAHGKHMKRTAAIAAHHGLSLSELDVLVAVRRSPRPWVLTPSDLQRSLLLSSGGLTKILAQLEARGLITRLTDDGDRRVKPVQLTDAALPLIETVLAESCVDERAWLRERLSDAQIAEVTALLARLAED